MCWSPWRTVFGQPGRLPWSKPPQTSSREPVPPASVCVAPSWPWVKLSELSYTGPPETASSLPLGACRSYGGVRRPPEEGTTLGCWWRLRMPQLVWRHRRCGQHFILGDDGSSGFQGDLHGWEVSELDQAEHLSLEWHRMVQCKKGTSHQDSSTLKNTMHHAVLVGERWRWLRRALRNRDGRRTMSHRACQIV